MASSFPVVVLTAAYIYGRALLLGCMVLPMLVYRLLRAPKAKSWDAPPKCLRDEELGQHGYVTVKGLKFHYVEKGDRSKPLMLFVHGFPEFWYSWRHQMKEFSKDYWTVAIDMRGYGDSSKPAKVSDYKVELLVDDIKGIVDELGKKTFILVAHDWGAVISWVFVDKYPEMVEKYVMMNGPHPKVYAYLMANSKSQSRKSWYIFLFQLPFLPELFVKTDNFSMFDRIFINPKKRQAWVTDDDIEAFKYTFSQPGAISPPINYYRAAMRRRVFEGFEERKTAKPKTGARPPGLYLFGVEDVAIDIANVEKHKDFFQPIETVLIPEGNHFVQQDKPQAVNDAMRSFLKK
ncbi:hypothetical protein ONE63_002813 [Megalurothrips usitatus]|uniref:AB hydrolase-1 domain-containing protein n=1 Tax=Megalurothrips usitatus TaxID=439358 RepID=A0AAV7X652_9NEOP|nr:hypothetical protein ONE63_002813 [Megalurothrips usitatus]